MSIEWTQTKARYEYYYGSTDTRFSEIGHSTNASKYAWMIFHDDFRYCVFGAEADTLDDAKRHSSDWLDANAKPHTTNA
jgi:hypothetical protein